MSGENGIRLHIQKLALAGNRQKIKTVEAKIKLYFNERDTEGCWRRPAVAWARPRHLGHGADPRHSLGPRGHPHHRRHGCYTDTRVRKLETFLSRERILASRDDSILLTVLIWSWHLLLSYGFHLILTNKYTCAEIRHMLG